MSAALPDFDLTRQVRLALMVFSFCILCIFIFYNLIECTFLLFSQGSGIVSFPPGDMAGQMKGAGLERMQTTEETCDLTRPVRTISTYSGGGR